MAESVTLKRGDVIVIPEIGTKLVGHIEQIRSDRYQIRLDEKFKPSIVIDVDTQA